MLFTFSDFMAFKEMFLDYKAVSHEYNIFNHLCRHMIVITEQNTGVHLAVDFNIVKWQKVNNKIMG